ncbi:MAG: SRPBCC family protein [Ilumatobacter sp.]
MAEITETITVNRPSTQVWSLVADFGAIAEWAPNVAHSSLTTEQSTGIGAVRRVQVGRNALLEEVTEWEPHAQLAYSIRGFPPVVRSAINTWRLSAVDDGTEVSLTSNVDAGGRPPQQLVARIIGRVMAKASREMLGGLKDQLEGSDR